MLNKHKLPWLEAGYLLFAKNGPQGLKIEVMATNINKNKSSFYYHFGDLQIFTSELLNFHLHKAKLYIVEIQKCKTMDPDLVNAIISVKQDLLFNKQLRINRTIAGFEQCIETSHSAAIAEVVKILALDHKISTHIDIIKNFITLTVDNFYLNISEQNINKEWLTEYFKQIKIFISSIKK